MSPHSLDLRRNPKLDGAGSTGVEVGCLCGWWSGQPVPAVHQSQEKPRPWGPIYDAHL